MQLAEGSENWCCAYVGIRDAALVGGCGPIAGWRCVGCDEYFSAARNSSSKSERCRRRGATFKLLKASPTNNGFAC